MRRAVFSLVAVAVLAGIVLADKVILTTGEILTGKVTKSGTKTIVSVI